MNYQKLQNAVASDAAIRLKVKLLPGGGSGSKVYPPTYAGGVYAWEKRLINKQKVDTVLLDSVQSQANRIEQALLEAYRKEKIKFPLIRIDLTQFFDIGEITTLDLPHRIADAVLVNSNLDGKKFRDSYIGKAFETANNRNATPVFQYCPHALIFGVWDSTGSRGGMGNKFQRVLTSEIVGIDAEKGVHVSSRIDPLIHKNPKIYKTPDGSWTLDEAQAKKNKDGKPVGKRVSEINLGNVTPDFKRYDDKKNPILRTMHEEIRNGDVLAGGVTIDHAKHTAVISMPALRRLRFPLTDKGENDTRNNAARTLLAALALSGLTHMIEQGYDLRSQCLLIPDGDPQFEVVANNGKTELFNLNADAADKIYNDAVERVKEFNLPWQEEAIELSPDTKLIELIQKSRDLESEEEE